MATPDQEPDEILQGEDLKKKLKKESKQKKKSKDEKKKSKKIKKAEKVQVENDEVVIPQEEEVVVEDDSTDQAEPIPEEEFVVDYQPEEIQNQVFAEENGEEFFDKTVGDERKIFISRIPATFDEEAITRTLNNAFGEDSVENVALTEAKKEDEYEPWADKPREENGKEKEKEHQGFAFVTMTSIEKRNEAIAKGTVKGNPKENSKRKHTLYIRPIVRLDEFADNEGVNDNCFLWTKFRCPYGADCKFKHVGEGACEEKREAVGDKRSKQKCFSFRTQGKCKLGEECPYSHDFEPKKSEEKKVVKKDAKDKDCINWKTKGKCRKGDKCPYRHGESVREATLAKKQKKVEKREREEDKVSQPLSIRVFGLNYDTTEGDVREYFKHCGVIKEITFPLFEDSGRSKGYCGVLFVSPKATEKACELDGQELHGRWLSVQPGKMYLKQWKEREEQGKKDGEGEDNEEIEEVPVTGEFGQKVKKRKTHGFKE